MDERSEHRGAEGRLVWRKSTISGNENCVEVAFSSCDVLVRDSKDRMKANLTFGGGAWDVFLTAVSR